MLYLLFGEDDYSARQALDEIKKTVGDETALATNTAVLDGSQVTVEEIKRVSETVPFLAEKRLVIINGLLGRFETRQGSGRKKTGAGRRGEYQPLAECLANTPDFTSVVLLDGKTDPKNPLFKQLSGQATLKSFPLLRGEYLTSWIQGKIRVAGSRITGPAVELLARFVGGNLWVMTSEIEKLVLFAAGRRIEEEDVRQVVSYAQEASVFTMVDAILEFRAGAAQRLLQQLLQQGASPAYLLVMVVRQVRIIVRMKELRRQRRSEIEIKNRLGIFNDFVYRKAQEQSARYSLERLKEVYHRLLETDLSIKTGRFEPELALNILLGELGRRQNSEIS
ncbi:MAG: DNA polymerase III subunit delta [Dehalococcoidales bacterium]